MNFSKGSAIAVKTGILMEFLNPLEKLVLKQAVSQLVKLQNFGSEAIPLRKMNINQPLQATTLPQLKDLQK